MLVIFCAHGRLLLRGILSLLCYQHTRNYVLWQQNNIYIPYDNMTYYWE